MARSWVGRTIFACWPCMAMLRLRETRHSYMNCENTEECYECAVVSRKMVDQIRSSPTLRHKGGFAYEWPRGSPWTPSLSRRGTRRWTQRLEMRRLLPYRVQRSPCRHSESDCFVACFVRAVPVFFAMVFPDEHNAPDDRALSWREMSAIPGHALAPSHA